MLFFVNRKVGDLLFFNSKIAPLLYEFYKIPTT